MFSLGSKEIEWHMNDIVVPVIRGSDDILPTLPMKVALAESQNTPSPVLNAANV